MLSKCNPDGYFPAISVHGRFLGRHGGTAKQEMQGLLGSGGFQASGEIERTGASRAGTFHDMEVDHRRFDAGMTHQALDCTNVGSRLEQMSDETVAHGVTGGPFGDGSLADGILELAL